MSETAAEIFQVFLVVYISPLHKYFILYYIFARLTRVSVVLLVFFALKLVYLKRTATFSSVFSMPKTKDDDDPCEYEEKMNENMPNRNRDFLEGMLTL